MAAARETTEVPGQEAASTRARILDIAQELFIEQGYDKTSLREIAERLGTTKAALYYHFERKQDILLALHMRLHDIGRETFERLEGQEGGPAGAEGWLAVLDEFIDQVTQNPDLFVLHQRNLNALSEIEHDERHERENEDMIELMRRLLGSPGIDVELRVRVSCAISAVMGGLIGGSVGRRIGGHDLLSDVPMATLARIVRETVHDILEPRRDAAG